jgi:hypothetical protein
MVEQEHCRDCNERHACRDVFEKLGRAAGPSVVLKVVLAFLLPLVIFIVSLAVFEWVLAGMIEAEAVQTGVSVLLALAVTFLAILIIKVINRRLSKNR